ncbi:hypothetical protein N665_0155s0010 [Sinapis alba]|nr:hypothetical protein N665_0155s0010 [Sinapis alba]
MAFEIAHGIPSRCPCGALTIVLTSKTKENSRRRFYRCGAVFGENHMFKWADEAHQEEIQGIAEKMSSMEKDLIEMKENILEIKKDITEIVKVVGCLSNMIRK